MFPGTPAHTRTLVSVHTYSASCLFVLCVDILTCQCALSQLSQETFSLCLLSSWSNCPSLVCCCFVFSSFICFCFVLFCFIPRGYRKNTLVGCLLGALNVQVPQRLVCLNTWSLDGGFWEAVTPLGSGHDWKKWLTMRWVTEARACSSASPSSLLPDWHHVISR